MESTILCQTCLTVLQKLLGIACFLLCAPFLITILTFFYIYRRLVKIILKIKLGDKFAGLLDGSDAIWSVEDDTSLSVINILFILKKPAGSTNTDFLNNTRKYLNHFSKNVTPELEKLFYHRYQKFGYFYWEKSTKFNPETAIRWLECENDNCDGSCEDVHSTIFQENLSSVCNKPLYDNHKPMWEMLIGRRCSKSTSYIEENSSLLSENCFNTDVDEIPLLFRIHHSLADGIALKKMVNEVITDEGDINKQLTIEPLNNSISTVNVNKSKKKERIFSITKNVSKLRQIYNKIKEIARTMILILLSLEIFFLQIVRNMDKSILHGQPLTGEKLTFFRLENDDDKTLLMKIKKIRKHTGSKFDDIILTAFAAGLIKYFSRMKEILPDAVSVIQPTRMSMPDEKLVLTNDFSVNILKTCFVNGDKEDIVPLREHCRFFERLQKTASINNKIRNSLQAPFNFFFIKTLVGIFPVEIIKLGVATYSTMGYSNMRGVERKLHIQNHYLSNIVGWIPNKSTTGLTLGAVTHEGKLNLTMLVDKAIIRDMELIREVIEETVREIDSAYNSLA